MRPLWRRWQSVLAVVLFCLNVDYVLMPLATSLGMPSGWPLFWFAAACATGEPMYWNWYAKWIVRNVVRSERVRRVTRAFTEQRLGEQLREFLEDKLDWFVEHAQLHANGDPAHQQLRERAAAVIRETHILVTYPVMLLFGILPSGWPFAIFIQRIFPVPGGFVVFLAANAVKTYFLGRLYLWLPLWGKALALACIIAVLMFGTSRIVRTVSALTRRSSGLP